MEHAAEVQHNLDMVLGPRFEIFTNGIHDLKETISDLRTTVELLRDTVVTSTSDIKVIKEDQEDHDKRISRVESAVSDVQVVKSRQEDHEKRISCVELISDEHKMVSADYRRSKAIVLWVAGVAVAMLSTVIGCVLSDCLESRRHAEEMKSRQALQESYNKLSEAVANLTRERQ
jgi:hypothetical protein